jgi:hypothetical protein
MTVSPSAQLITDAVVAEYIHEISVRHRSREPASRTRREATQLQAPASLGARARKSLKLLERSA